MDGKSYSSHAGNNDASNQDGDWAKSADKAAKKAEEELDKIKREAREELTSGKASYNNPNDH